MLINESIVYEGDQEDIDDVVNTLLGDMIYTGSGNYTTRRYFDDEHESHSCQRQSEV